MNILDAVLNAQGGAAARCAVIVRGACCTRTRLETIRSVCRPFLLKGSLPERLTGNGAGVLGSRSSSSSAEPRGRRLPSDLQLRSSGVLGFPRKGAGFT